MRLELQQVTLRHHGKPALLESVDLVLEPGELVVVRGPSGSGKSSLLRLLDRLAEPAQGRILVDGIPMVDLEVTDLRRRIGHVPQTPVMIDGTVRDNLVLSFRFKAARGALPPGDDVLLARLTAHGLDTVGLDDDAAPLSVGQKQRVALIRVLLADPELLLCDEPTSALDAASATVVEGELERLHRERGIGIVLVTHAESRLERIATRRFVLAGGSLREGES